VRMPAGLTFIAIGIVSVCVLPSNVKVATSFSTMHWTKIVLESYDHAMPRHQWPIPGFGHRCDVGAVDPIDLQQAVVVEQWRRLGLVRAVHSCARRRYGMGSSKAGRSPHGGVAKLKLRLLLNNQATDRLRDDPLKLAWPFGLGSCPKVDHDADDANRAPEGDRRIWKPCARRDRPRSRTALVQHFRFLLCGTSAAVVIAARRASRSKTANSFQLGAKDSAGTQMRGVNNGYPRSRRPHNSFC
jgi:hypothetical protein